MAPPSVPSIGLNPSSCCLTTLPPVKPLSLVLKYVKLYWIGVKYWRNVARAAKAGHALADRVDGLEKGARAVEKAIDEEFGALYNLPDYPLATDDKSGRMTVSADELAYVQEYGKSARSIADNAAALRAELDKAIEGWDAAVKQANDTDNFTRASAFEAITVLDMQFSKGGGGFRAFLVAQRQEAERLERWAREKEFHAAHIMGEWTPDWYQPPTPNG